jgi:predicted phage baseplate assembly protein
VTATPADTRNLPGRAALHRRVGTYAAFLESMRADLARARHPALAGLRTRAPSDPTMALLDAWAVAGDVLSFYQERLANEGYLRTATERRSVFELARLVGYAPRPGVSASVYLAFTLDPTAVPLEIPAGTKAQDVPDPGQRMQTFETAEPLEARAEWNVLAPRLGSPPVVDLVAALTRTTIRVTGVSLDLKPGDRLLLALEEPARPTHVVHVLRRVAKATPLFDLGATDVSLQPRSHLTEAVAQKLVDIHDRLVAGAMDGTIVDRAAATKLIEGFAAYALGARLQDLRQVAQEAGHTADPALAGLAGEVEALVDSLLGVAPARPKAATPINPLSLIRVLDRPAVRIPRSPAALERSVATAFAVGADTVPQLIARFRPQIAESYYQAWRNLPAHQPQAPTPAGDEPDVDVDDTSFSALRLHATYVLRAMASLFGYNAPRTKVNDAGKVVANDKTLNAEIDSETSISLESVDDGILTGSLLLIDRGRGRHPIVARARTVTARARDDYGVQGKSTHIDLEHPGTGKDLIWRPSQANLDNIRKVLVHTRSEPLTLADDPIDAPVDGRTIELPTLLDGLTSGRRLIVAGERADIKGPDGTIVRGVEGRELAMLAGVTQGAAVGDRSHTTLVLSADLGSSYVRDTVRIYANVVKATHGETHAEPLGNGNAAQPLQRFALKQVPLTFVSAPTPQGIDTTLEVRVNEVRWHETDALAAATPSDRVYVTRIDEDATTSVTFGSGEHGARLPSGTANVRAHYRSGIGRAGNVKADRITLLASRPLGVREVTNPLRASGGADAETRDQARRHVPLAVTALDRLVSLRDYADFARTFAGVGHADAALLSDGGREVVCVTVAGVDDIPIDADSDLLQNLAAALRRFGDPTRPVRVLPRELLALVVVASVAIDADYLWDDVSQRMRAAMYAAFAFDRRPLGRAAYLAEAFAALQAVRGVRDVDVDVFDAVSERELTDASTVKARIGVLSNAMGAKPNRTVPAASAERADDAPARAALWPAGTTFLPAQLAFLVPDVPDTLILNPR